MSFFVIMGWSLVGLEFHSQKRYFGKNRNICGHFKFCKAATATEQEPVDVKCGKPPCSPLVPTPRTTTYIWSPFPRFGILHLTSVCLFSAGALSCPDLAVIPDSDSTSVVSGKTSGQNHNVVCDPGYTGTDIARCTDDGSAAYWSNVPTCTGRKHPTLPPFQTLAPGCVMPLLYSLQRPRAPIWPSSRIATRRQSSRARRQANLMSSLATMVTRDLGRQHAHQTPRKQPKPCGSLFQCAKVCLGLFDMLRKRVR